MGREAERTQTTSVRQYFEVDSAKGRVGRLTTSA